MPTGKTRPSTNAVVPGDHSSIIFAPRSSEVQVGLSTEPLMRSMLDFGTR